LPEPFSGSTRTNRLKTQEYPPMHNTALFAELFNRETFYHELFRKNPIPQWLADPDSFVVIDANDAALAFVRKFRQDVISKNYLETDLCGTNRFEQIAARVRTEGGCNYRTKYLLDNGESREVDCECIGVTMMGTRLLHITALDVGSFRFAADQLKFGEQLFTQFMVKSPVSVAMLDSQMNYLLTSQRWIDEMAGEARDLIGKNHFAVIKNQPPHWLQAYERALGGHSESFEQDIFIRPGGKLDWIRWEVSPWYNTENKIGGIIIFVEMITQRKKVDEISNRLIEQRSRIAARVETVEEERRKIARELHDGLGQLLTAAHLNLELAEQDMSDDPEQAKEALSRVKDIITTTIREVRNISQNLRPAVLDDFGLVAAVRNLCDDFSRTGTVQVQFSDYEMQKHYSPAIEIATYRICQEALSNIARHSKATEASVDIYNRESYILIVIQDNGTGFDPSDPRQSNSGSGLINIRERAELLGGNVQIESRTDNGTEILIELPLKPDESFHEYEQDFE
jgi:PAS domain S-box-containing protein